jgi:hypothetical protein
MFLLEGLSMRLRLLVALAPAVLATLLLAGGASGNVNPALTGFSHMVVDAAHGHVFVTGAASDSSIAVINTNGDTATKINNETGAGGMAIVGDTLYVARCAAGVIDEIDIPTLTRTGTFAASVGGNCDLAYAGGRLWYSNAPDAQDGALMSVSLDSSHTEINSGLGFYGMIFATSPADPNWLVIGEAGLSSPPVVLEDVSDPSNVTQLGVTSDFANIRDLAISSDGGTLFTVSGGSSAISSFALPSMTAGSTYTTGLHPDAVAISPNGGKLATGMQLSNGVWVYNSGTAAAKVKATLGTGQTLYPRGLAFSPDGTRIYAVASAPNGKPVFHVVPTVPLLKGSVSIKRSKATVTYGQKVTLTVHLGTSSSMKTVTIYQKPVDGTAFELHTGKVGPSGNLTWVTKPNHDTTYSVKWAGDATHSPATSTGVRVNVHLSIHVQYQGGSTASGVRVYHYNAACSTPAHTGCPRFLAWAEPLQPHRKVSYVVQARQGTGAWHTVLTGGANAPTSGHVVLVVFYSGRAFIGLNQRVHFTVAKSSSVLGGTSAWKPFRITS